MVSPRRSDMRSDHRGNYWVGTFEIAGDKPQGTLTSVPFKVTQPFASFLVAGGSHENTRVELVRADTQQVIFKASGYDSENLRPVVVDLKAHQGKEIFIRLIDRESGGWGHINFDDFKLYAQRPSFPNELDPSKAAQGIELPPVEVMKFTGLAPEQAAKEMTLPPGFKATLFAGEPDVKQPIAFAIDDRGRLWVAEAYTYPNRAKEGEGKDRIVVFEDTDGDGKFNKRTVFTEGLNLVSGIELGFGGVYVGAAPYLMFIPIQDGDEPKPAGKPQILLDGWAYQDTHETLNTFTWGPDGWLYGCHGVFTHSNIGKPGAPDSERTRINAGVWRYHPTKHTFEVFAEGTSNPWGIDFDEHGQCVIEACVIPHLFHMVQGGRFTRQAGSHFNPYVYDDITTVADHVHWAGNKGPHAANARSAAVGGGHAHAGLMIYQGDNWPAEYRGKIFMNNIHGARINMDIPERDGSGFVGHHGKDLINFNDKWSQIINLQSGPDGAVYLIDWYDKNECHSGDANLHDRSNGRIFKISYGETKFEKVDLQKLTDEELVKLLASKNSWRARHAQRILAERFVSYSAQLPPTTASIPSESAERAIHARSKMGEELWKVFKESTDSLVRLHALWTLHSTRGELNMAHEEKLKLDGTDDINSWRRFLADESEFVRAWEIQLLVDDDVSNIAKSKWRTRLAPDLARLAREDKSPIVRLYLASAMQRLPVEDRWEVVEALSQHAEDANDHNLPLMVWYAAEPLPAKDFNRALAIAENAKLPDFLNFTVRRTAALNKAEAFAAITKTLLRVANQGSGAASSASPSNQSAGENSRARVTRPSEQKTLDILNGLSFALKGQRSAPMPQGWNEVETKLSASANPEIRALVQSLSLTFGSQSALAALKKALTDKSADSTARKTALDSLLNSKDPSLVPLLQDLLADAQLQGQVIRALAAFDDPKTPTAILTAYNSFDAASRRDALNTLASRASFAKPLLDAVNAGAVPKKDLTAELVRQLRNLKNSELNDLLAKLWGVMRDSAADKQKEIEKVRSIYRAGGSQPGDAIRGRAVYARVCSQCHTLFGAGGKVGPDLTGSNRGDIDYLLQNIVDPNAVIPNDYRAWNLDTKDDRSISGIMKQQDEKSVTIITANETLTIPRGEIKSLREGELSMMPEGLLQNLPDQEIRDLIYYLRGQAQAPLLATPDTVALLFSGKDLSNWDGNEDVWHVENGEIVGKTATGLKHNEFLKSQLVLTDFRLTCKMKLVPNSANSGIQFRSEPFGEYEMRGPQADAGAGWWGKLYEENGRALLWDKSGEQFVKADDWNTYEIVAVGGKVRTSINGHICADVDDEKISKRGIIGLQVHSGGPTEVRFKDFQLELISKADATTTR